MAEKNSNNGWWAFHFRLRTMLVAAFVLLSMLPLVIVTSIIIGRSFRHDEQQVINQLESLTETKTAAIEEALGSHQATLRMLFSDQWLHTSLFQLLNPTSDIFLTNDERINRYLEDVLASQEGYAEFFIYNMGGSIVAATTEDQIGQAVNGLPYFASSFAEERIHPPYYTADSPDLNVVLTRPIKDGDTTVGVLAGYLKLSVLADVMTQYEGMGETGETYLVAVDNNYLLTPSRFEGYPENHAYQTEGIAEALTGHEGTGIYTGYRDTEVIGVYRWLPYLEAGLLAEIELSEAQVATWDAVVVSLAAAVLVGLGALVVGLHLAMRITAPIIRLTGTTQRFSAGDLTARSSLQVKNEVGELAAVFNQMADNLQAVLGREAAARENMEEMVAQYVAFAQQVADGDLTVRLTLPEHAAHDDTDSDTHDDLYHLGWNLNAMAEGLSAMTRQTYETANEVSAAAAEILAATMQQLAATTEQDASVTQTMATVGEVQGAVTQTAERSDNVAAAAQQSVAVSERGLEAVTASMSSMEMIQDRVQDIAQNILALSEQTQQIGAITTTVQDIADQSRLLALNASIEAARAGDAGRGFAVVAMEVRNLADQSRQATEQIGSILREIQEATNTSVMATEEGSKGVDRGVMQLNETGTVIEELAAIIRDAAQTSAQIAASTRQQSTGMDQLTAAMTSIQQATLQGQASTEQSEKSAQNMTTIAREMQASIARYKV